MKSNGNDIDDLKFLLQALYGIMISKTDLNEPLSENEIIILEQIEDAIGIDE